MKARYGLQLGSGSRSSSRVPKTSPGDVAPRTGVGTRIRAPRLWRPQLPGDRRFVAGHEPLVRVDDRRHEGAHARRVLELAGQERPGDGRHPVRVGRVVEDAAAAIDRPGPGGCACRSPRRRRAAWA